MAGWLRKLSTAHDRALPGDWLTRLYDHLTPGIPAERFPKRSSLNVALLIHSGMWMSCVLPVQRKSLQVNSLSTLSTEACG
jgi:hypothetical protein